MPEVTESLNIQELVFIASLYDDPHRMRRYGGMLNSAGVFQTRTAGAIWKKSWEYYSEYYELPSEDVMADIFTPDEIDNLKTGIGVARDDEVRASFLCDRFSHGLDLIFLKAVHQEITDIVNNPLLGTVDGGRFLDTSMDRLMGKIAKSRVSLDRSGVTIRTAEEIEQMWEHNEYPSQGEMIPVVIPGSEKYLLGTPLGSVNVIVAPYGTGKTSVLASMAVEYLKVCDVLYATFEIAENAVYFRLLANVSDGAVKMENAFKKQEELTDSEYETYKRAGEDLRSHGHMISVLDAPPDTIRPSEIANHIVHMMVEHRLHPKVVFVDYSSLLRTNSGGNRGDLGWQYVGQIVTELCSVAKKYDLVIWTAAQAGGEQAHVQSASSMGGYKDIGEFKPLTGQDLYGSKEALQNASLVFGLNVVRSAECPWVATGVLSTFKNRYGSSYNNFLVNMDYSRSRIKIVSAILTHDKAAIGDIVRKDLGAYAAWAEKDGKRRGLETVKEEKGFATRGGQAKKDPRKMETKGHDEQEY